MTFVKYEHIRKSPSHKGRGQKRHTKVEYEGFGQLSLKGTWALDELCDRLLYLEIYPRLEELGISEFARIGISLVESK